MIPSAVAIMVALASLYAYVRRSQSRARTARVRLALLADRHVPILRYLSGRWHPEEHNALNGEALLLEIQEIGEDLQRKERKAADAAVAALRAYLELERGMGSPRVSREERGQRALRARDEAGKAASALDTFKRQG
jgi:hypothetical protein